MKIGDTVEVPESTNTAWQGVGSVTEVHGSTVLVRMQTGKMTGYEGGFLPHKLKVIPPVADTVAYLRSQAKFLETAADLIERRFDSR